MINFANVLMPSQRNVQCTVYLFFKWIWFDYHFINLCWFKSEPPPRLFFSEGQQTAGMLSPGELAMVEMLEQHPLMSSDKSVSKDLTSLGNVVFSLLTALHITVVYTWEHRVVWWHTPFVLSKLRLAVKTGDWRGAILCGNIKVRWVAGCAMLLSSRGRLFCTGTRLIGPQGALRCRTARPVGV